MRICFLGTDARLDHVRRYAAPGTTVDNLSDFVGTISPPTAIETRVDELELARAVVEQCIEAERRGYDAVVTACLGDPGVEAAREMVRIPVVAPGETALLTARMIASHFSILTPVASTLPIAREQAHKAGLSHFVASIRVFGYPVERIRDREPAMLEALAALGRRCVEEDGADAVVMACASMSVLADEVKDRIGVPVIDAVRLSVKAAEMLVGAGLTHSAVTYPPARAPLAEAAE